VGTVELSSEASGPWEGLSKVGRANCSFRPLGILRKLIKVAAEPA
jgi:hypothetical protein